MMGRELRLKTAQFCLMLHIIKISYIDGFTVMTKSSFMISDRLTMKSDMKSSKLRVQLSNDSPRDDLTEINPFDADDEMEDEGLSMEALQKAREGAPDEFAIMKEVRVRRIIWRWMYNL